MATIENPPSTAEKPPTQGTQPSSNLKEEPSEEPTRARARGVRQEKALLVSQAIDTWNRICGAKLPKAIAATGARAKRIHDRIAVDCAGELDRFEAVCRSVVESDFLTGSRGFMAGIDWVVNPTNWQKIVEGNYRNRTEKPRQSHFMDNLEALGYVPEAKRGPVNVIDGELAQ